MCPEPQILSIYMDGELPSPWKEKMESHLAVCPKCKERLGNYKHVQELFKKDIQPSVRSQIPEVQKRTIVERDGKNNLTENEIPADELLETSKERVWKKLANAPLVRQRYSSAGLVRKSGNIKGYGLWTRKLSLPLPVAALAAALLVLFGIVFFRQSRETGNFNNQITEFPNLIDETHDYFIPAAADMNSVLQYLDATGTDIIILQLPENRNFSRAGEPQIIRAADYSSRRRQ